MAKPFRPMLACPAPSDLEQICYPVLVSPKLDGIRCIIRDGVAVSRKLKPIPNRHIQERLAGLPDGLDGELIVGEPTGPGVFARSTSGVMSADGEPDFQFHVFDHLSDAPFHSRHAFAAAEAFVTDAPVTVVVHELTSSVGQLLTYEKEIVAEGYEGVMIRSTGGPYKFGRSTEREGYLLKLKRFHDAEAIVIGKVERFHNANEATTDALGYTKRSQSKAGKVGTGMLGALVCQLRGAGPDLIAFEIGSGFTEAQRREIWAQKVVGSLVKFKYQELTPDGVPRFPVFLGWRDVRDME